MKHWKRTTLQLLSLLMVGGSILIAWAAAGDPRPLFTDNITAVGTTTAVTDMEQVLLTAIDGATTSIDVAIYGFDRASIRDALIAAHNRGVTVRLVGDDEAAAEAAYAPYYNALTAAGIPLVLDDRSSLMHNKFLVVDGLVVWTGSTNMTNTGFTYNHNNSLVFTSTQLADIFITEFDEMFVDQYFGTAKTDNTVHQLDYQGIQLEIYFSPSDGALSELIDEVNGAQDSIAFSIFYFTDDALRDALVARAQSGVSISGIWDRLGAANQYSDDEALCAAGIPIKIEDFGGKMHNKFMVIDAGGAAPRVVTGSMNWTGSGGGANDENTVIVHDGPTAGAYAAAFEQLWAALDDDTLCSPGAGGYYLLLPVIVGGTAAPGPTPTPSATPPPGAADVRLTYIEYNPDGDDVAGEYVDLQNIGSDVGNMTGWTLRDEDAHVYTFPAFSLAAGATVRVWTKGGTDTETDLYWGSGAPIWNNTGDTAMLQEQAGQVVDVCSYVGGGTGTSCP